MRDPGLHLFWISSRAAGIAALVLASLSIVAGQVFGGRVARKPGRTGDLRAVHGTLSVATLIAIALHGSLLLGDSYLHPSLAGITIPLTIDYRPAWTALGILAGYGLAVSGLVFWARERLGPRRWKVIHRASALVWVLAVVHAIGSGTDRAQPWFVVSVGLVVVAVVGMTVVRIAGAWSRGRARGRGSLAAP